MKKLLLTTAIVLLTLVDTFACFNGETQRLKNGTIISHDGYAGIGELPEIIPKGHNFFEINYEKELKELDTSWKNTKDVAYLSDYGLVLSLQKKYNEAKEIYLKIEETEPNRYSTASNLGTVYELLGDNENALKWIKRAVEIDPTSHKNSEWLHVKILEAKINGEQSINSDFLLNTNFGTDPTPTSSLSKNELLKLRDSLYYQLNERVSFIKPKDKIVAALMFDLANVAFLTNARQEALKIYATAKDYGFSDTILQARVDNARKTTREAKPSLAEDRVTVADNPISKEEPKSNNYLTWAIIGLIGFAVIAFTTVMIRLRKKSLR
jgi:tetratricopeptide (TPR) repeat protein